MPLTEFVRYLNAQLPLSRTASPLASPFVAAGRQVYVDYGKYRLGSAYSPIVSTATGDLCGHAASLDAVELANGHPCDQERLFALAPDNQELIYLDRLVRTLHTLNYLTYHSRHPDGLLLLRVHPRHIASVATDHGLAFEEILRACGLLPRQITLQLTAEGVADTQHLRRAIASYSARGYSIALGRIDPAALDLSLLRDVQPALVKLHRRLLAEARPIRGLVDQLHEVGARIILEGWNTETARCDAHENGFDLIEIHALSRRLLHARETPAEERQQIAPTSRRPDRADMSGCQPAAR